MIFTHVFRIRNSPVDEVTAHRIILKYALRQILTRNLAENRSAGTEIPENMARV